MKTIKYLLGAAIIGSLLSVSAFAIDKETTVVSLAAPVVSKVVHPTGLMDRHEGATVHLAMTIDELGQPHDIRLLAPYDPYLSRQLIPTIAQWRFTPALRNGQPVARRVVLPLKLVIDS